MIGIYAISFHQINEVYIGLSVHTEKRFKTHLNSMLKNKHPNYKVQAAFNKYGNPEFHLVEECLLSELNAKEILWTDEFDSLHNGLNIITPGVSGGSGCFHGKSRYSEEEILAAFKLLVHTNVTHKEVSDRTGVSYNVVRDVSCSILHSSWLKEQFPKDYTILMAKTGTRRYTVAIEAESKKVYLTRPPLKSPDGTVHPFTTSIRGFARLHGLNQGNLNQFLLGKRKSVQGWTLA